MKDANHRNLTVPGQSFPSGMFLLPISTLRIQPCLGNVFAGFDGLLS